MNYRKVIIASTVVIIFTLLINPPANAQVQLPSGINGAVYMSDGITEAPEGTNFSVKDVTTGEYIEGTTGAGPHSGWYSVSINGVKGDEVSVKAWNSTHYGGTTVTLLGDMSGINIIINETSIQPSTTSAQTYSENREDDITTHSEKDHTAIPETSSTSSTTSTPQQTSVSTQSPAAISTITTASATEFKEKIPGFEVIFVVLGSIVVVGFVKRYGK